MRIPKRFKLGAQTFEVTYKKDLAESENLLGCIRFGTGEITLQPAKKGLLSKEMAGEVFVHEMVHGIFSKVFDDNIDTEANVSAVATMLYQALVTMEYK